MIRKLTLMALLAIFSFSSQASQVVQLATPIDNYPHGNVEGVRFSLLYGRTSTVKGVDLNMIGLSDINNFSGLGISLYGVQLARSEFSGVSIGLANWHDNVGKGGVLGTVNYTRNNFSGVQVGAFNYAGTLNGLQLGFVNATQRINRGVQIGFINYDASGTLAGSFPVFPLINARF